MLSIHLLFDQCYLSIQAWLEVNWLHGASVSASQRAGLIDWLVEVILNTKYHIFNKKKIFAGLIDWLVEVIPNTKYHNIIAHWRKYYVLL